MYQNYSDFVDSLFLIQDLKYQEFSRKLTFTKYEIIGIRVPNLRKIAKDIVKNDYQKFLREVKSNYYEEVFIEGLVIASLPEEELLIYLPNFIDKIDDWAICDSFCNSLKFLKKDHQKYFGYFSTYLSSNKEFKVRLGLVIFLNFYVHENYINKIFNIIDQIVLDKYYVNMAIAWLLCECFIKYLEETTEYLKTTQINNFAFNKTISKIMDSYRISKEEKEKLKKLRR